jgi:hypothetical protein
MSWEQPTKAWSYLNRFLRLNIQEGSSVIPADKNGKKKEMNILTYTAIDQIKILN